MCRSNAREACCKPRESSRQSPIRIADGPRPSKSRVSSVCGDPPSTFIGFSPPRQDSWAGVGKPFHHMGNLSVSAHRHTLTSPWILISAFHRKPASCAPIIRTWACVLSSLASHHPVGPNKPRNPFTTYNPLGRGPPSRWDCDGPGWRPPARSRRAPRGHRLVVPLGCLGRHTRHPDDETPRQRADCRRLTKFYHDDVSRLAQALYVVLQGFSCTLVSLRSLCACSVGCLVWAWTRPP